MPKTLLLADDSVVIQKLVGLSFANEDVDLLTADNGDDAIALASANRPDVVIADVIMPGKSGYEVCEAVKQDPALAHIPVLLLTGTFEAFDEDRAQAVGSAGHITKPFEAQALVARVHELFASPPPAAAPAEVAVDEPATAAADEQTASDEAFDFFEDDVSDLSSVGGPDPLVSEDVAIASEPDLDAGLLGSDSTVALMPEEPNAGTEPFSADLAAELVEIEAEPDPEPDASATVLAEDLFESPPSASSDWLAPPEEAAPAPAETVVADFDLAPEPIADEEPILATPEPLAREIAEIELAREPADEAEPVIAVAPDEALADPDDFSGAAPMAAPALVEPPVDATVLPDDLFETSREAELAAEPEVAVEPEAFEVGEAELEPAFDAAEPEVPAAPTAPPAAAAAMAPPVAGSHDALTDAIRDRLHETLEKVAWEAFSELSEQVVRQVLERVETIAWEVIPQMTETMIREEIRRMKGEDAS